MGYLVAPDDGWRDTEYESAWARFDGHFGFAPDFHEHDSPAIRLPAGCLVIDLSSLFYCGGAPFSAGQAAINAVALRSFVWLAAGEDLLALDWQHAAHRYRPAQQALGGLPWHTPVFPNGDYVVHTTADLRWGTFGHPWQQSLTIWGDDLVGSLGHELLTWLPRHKQSLA